MKTQLMLLGLVLFVCTMSVAAKKKFARASGRILCRINGRAYPVKYAKVSLLTRIPSVTTPLEPPGPIVWDTLLFQD